MKRLPAVTEAPVVSLDRLLARPKTVALRPTILIVAGYLVREVSADSPTCIPEICAKTELSQDAVQRVLRLFRQQDFIVSTTVKELSPPRMLIAPAPRLLDEALQSPDLQNEITLQQLQIATGLSRTHILQQALVAWSEQGPAAP